MTELPTKYQWLKKENAPRMLIEALKLYGTLEQQGEGNNPIILGWAKECMIFDYKADSTPWCGLFMAVVAQRSGKYIPKFPLWALSWQDWGTPSPKASLGDVLVFTRKGGGHVGLYVGEDTLTFHVLGGNQGDAVSIKRIEKSRCVGVRRLYKIGVPPNVRPVMMAANGALSVNEA